MVDRHPVIDDDARLTINLITREIESPYEEIRLVQGDHNSERITFEIPKLVDGHDMSLCDRIEIHSININKKTKETRKDIYLVDDASSEDDKVVFSWLVQGNAIPYWGAFRFLITFVCVDDSGNYTYLWHTEFCKLITIGEGSDNTETITEEYPDILQKFKNEILAEMAQLRFTRYLEDVVEYVIREGQILFRIKSPLARNENDIYEEWFDIKNASIMMWIQIDKEDGSFVRQFMGSCRKIKFGLERNTERIWFDIIFSPGSQTRYVVNDSTIDVLEKRVYNAKTVDNLVSDAKALGLSSATVGQTVRVKAVDSSGKPTEWESVDEITPDYEENDPTSRNYIKNRPFYENIVFQCELTPDMDVSEMETIQNSIYMTFIHISDTVIPEGTCNVTVVTTTTDGEEVLENIARNERLEYDENGYTEIGDYFVLINRDTEVNGISAKKGIYIVQPSMLGENIAKAVFKIEILKTIDERFLPDSINESLDAKMSSENPTGTGTFSMNSSKATGQYSFAEGDGNTASGKYSHAEGYGTKASGYMSHSEGMRSESQGFYSHAEGRESIAREQYSHAEGHKTKANGTNAHAEGELTTATSISSHAEGVQTTASGTGSHAEGYGTITSADASHAQGKYNVKDTKSKYAHIVGNGTSDTNRSNAHTLDWDGNGWFAGDVYVGSTSGTNWDDGSKKLATETYVDNAKDLYYETTDTINLTKDLDVSAYEVIEQEGTNCKCKLFKYSDEPLTEGDIIKVTANPTDVNTGMYSVVYVSNVASTGNSLYTSITESGNTTTYLYRLMFSVSEDNSTIDLALGSSYSITLTLNKGTYIVHPNTIGDETSYEIALIKVYDKDVIMAKNNSHGIGTFSMNDSKAIGLCSTAIGSDTVASGNNSMAEGYKTESKGVYSHAEGFMTKAIGSYSHAEGGNSIAFGSTSHSEGTSEASGSKSHAEGHKTVASGEASHSEGWFTIASGNYSHVMGKYNIEDAENKYAFIIGGGTDKNKRKNIFTVDWNGAATFGNPVSLSSNFGITQPYQLTTKSYVDGEINVKCLNFYVSGSGGIRYVTNDDQITFEEVLAYPYRYPIATFDGIRSTGEYAINGILTQRIVSDEVIIYANYELIEENGAEKVVQNFVEFRSDGTKTTYGTETIGYLNAQADWDEQNEEAQGYIKNKPSFEPIVIVYTHTYNDVNFTLCGVKPSEVTYSEMCELLNENAPFLINVNHKPVLYWDFEQNQSTGKYTFTYYSVGSDAGEIKLKGSSVSGIPFKDESTNTSTNTSTSTSTSTST